MKSCMKTKRCAFRSIYENVIRKIFFQIIIETIRRNIRHTEKIYDLRIGMDARIGSPGNNQSRRSSGNELYRLSQYASHRSFIRLLLKSFKKSSIICQCQYNILQQFLLLKKARAQKRSGLTSRSYPFQSFQSKNVGTKSADRPFFRISYNRIPKPFKAARPTHSVTISFVSILSGFKRVRPSPPR